jgi:formylglycine-generating enzyme required for sulfatase activity
MGQRRVSQGTNMAAGATHTPDHQSKARIFISYSRKDVAFAEQLEAALKARGFEPLIDRQDPIALQDWSKGIAPFENWWKRIETLIGKADTIVFVLSPDAVASKIALKEIDYAASLNKRFAPVVCRKVDDTTVPEALRNLHYIFFDDLSRFDASADHLAAALQIDLDWIRKHSEYGETARRWATAGRPGPQGLLLRSPVLEEAERWITSRPQSAPAPTEETVAFVAESRRAAIWRRLRMTALASAIVLMAVAVLTVWWQHDWLKDRVYILKNVNALAAAQEKTLKPGQAFKECTNCPDMIMVTAGSFAMGSPEGQDKGEERPQHAVTIIKPFAVSKYEVTFAEWDACWAQGGCPRDLTVFGTASNNGSARGQRPVLNVNWNEAKQYVAWLSKITGDRYRLLTEAEYEYATRAGTTTAYPWGDEIELNGQAMGNNGNLAPVGSFPPNKFGLYDMVGSVWEWTEDCDHRDYKGAPTDGSAWLADSGPCNSHVIRGGGWGTYGEMRSAARSRASSETRNIFGGFRVARTLDVTLTQQEIERIKQQQVEQQNSWCRNDKHAFSGELEMAGCMAMSQFGRLNINDLNDRKDLTEAYLNRGNAFVNEGHSERALADYNQAIALDPKNADAFNARCYARAILGQLQTALADCNQSLALRPNDAATLDSRGLTYLKLGQFDNAIADYNAVLKINPKKALSLYGRGIAEFNSGDLISGPDDIEAAEAIQFDVARQMVALGVNFSPQKKSTIKGQPLPP